MAAAFLCFRRDGRWRELGSPYVVSFFGCLIGAGRRWQLMPWRVCPQCSDLHMRAGMMWLPTAALSSMSASFGVTCVGFVSVFDAFRAGFGGFRWAHFARRRDEGCCCFRSWDLGTRRHTPSERLRCKARAGSGCRPSPWLRSLSGPGGTASRSPMAMRGRLRAVVLPRPVWVRRLASCGSFASVRHRPGATVGSLCRSLSALHRGLTIPMPLRPLRYA